jgi:hypothetical protein
MCKELNCANLKIVYSLRDVLPGHVHLSVIITLMMEAISTSETSVSFYQTMRRNIPEDIFILAAARTFFYSKACCFYGVILDSYRGKPCSAWR